MSNKEETTKTKKTKEPANKKAKTTEKNDNKQTNQIPKNKEKEDNTATKEANEKLDEVKPKSEFEGEADLTHQFQYGTDYNLGDVLELINEFKMEGNVRMTEIIFSHDSSGETIVPSFRSLQEEEDENKDYNKEDD